ncbi:hypothetical protein [Streptomyces sp. B8F3]|uniref:hypothetical protein n=1 Tax=unclassified Streptomyces TaxID=2593676 RepID=UPI00325F3291
MTLEQWENYGLAHSGGTGAKPPRLIPRVLDAADEEVVSTMPGVMPEHVKARHHEQREPGYASADKGNAGT